MKLLLDTCTFLWIILDSPELSEEAQAAFVDPGNEVYLSAVSTWEIAVKQSLGRLRLPRDLHRFLPAQRKRHGIAPLPLHEEATLFLARLPGLHRDPFDRMLISQALHHGMLLVTPDDDIRRYAVPTLW